MTLLLPFGGFRLESALPPTEVMARLRRRIVNPTLAERTAFGTEAMFRRLEGQSSPEFLEGVLDDRNLTFRLTRFISGRNSFLPVLIGSVRASGSGSDVRVFGRPAWVTTVLTAAFVVLASTDLFQVMPAAAPPLVRVGRILLPLFGLALYFGVFMVEFARARELLRSVLEKSEEASSRGAT